MMVFRGAKVSDNFQYPKYTFMKKCSKTRFYKRMRKIVNCVVGNVEFMAK